MGRSLCNREKRCIFLPLVISGVLFLIAPDWRQALSLKKAMEDRISKDGVIGIGITATAVGLIVGGILAALARKN